MGGKALAAAKFIQARSANYSAAPKNAVSSALNQWGAGAIAEGGGTLGISATMSFLGELAAELSSGDWLVLGAAIGLTHLAMYEGYKCLKGT